MLAIALGSTVVGAQSNTSQLDEVMTRVGAYVAAYGEKTSVVVAREVYVQGFTIAGGPGDRPRALVAEFAIVRTGDGWTGFRDVIEVDGTPVHDRPDRLAALLTSSSPTVGEAMRIANESARFNVGPVVRNFNTPTTAMFFFLPEHLARFTFSRKGTSTIDRVVVMEIAFKETRSPTFVMTRAGTDVPVEGSLWVSTVDGTVMRTRLRMRNFADAVVPRTLAGGVTRLNSSADIDVTYQRPPGMDLWLPATMVERYEGPIEGRTRAIPGRATTRATYSDFKQFSTTSRIIPQ